MGEEQERRREIRDLMRTISWRMKRLRDSIGETERQRDILDEKMRDLFFLFAEDEDG